MIDGCYTNGKVVSLPERMEVVDVDLEQQNRVINIYVIIETYIPIITTPIYLEAIYCVIKKSPNFLLHYTIILMAHILGCCLEEFYGFQLFRPMVFLPVVGIYADGLLSTLGVHPFIQLYGMFLAVQLNTAFLSHITFYRLKIIIPMSFRYYTRVVQFGIFSIVFVYVLAVSTVSCLFLLVEDQTEAKNYLSMTLRQLPAFFWSEKYMVSTPRNPHTPLFIALGGVCISFYMIVCITLPTICYIILHKTRHSLSEKVLTAQRAYLRTILIQVVAVVLCIVIPFGVFFASLKSTITNPLIIAVCTVLALLHGVASTVIHLLSNKPFRDVMKSQLSWVWCCMTCTNPKRRSLVRTMSSIVG